MSKTKTSKFSSIFDSRKSEETEASSQEQVAEDPISEPSVPQTTQEPTTSEPSQLQVVREPTISEPSQLQALPEPTIGQPPPAKKMGRPAGKRSNPDYTQVTAYIQTKNHHAAKVALLTNGEGLEFSELIDMLISEWLKTQKSKNSIE